MYDFFFIFSHVIYLIRSKSLGKSCFQQVITEAGQIGTVENYKANSWILTDEFVSDILINNAGRP